MTDDHRSTLRARGQRHSRMRAHANAGTLQEFCVSHEYHPAATCRPEMTPEPRSGEVEKGSLDPVNKTSTQRSRRTATGRSNTRLSIGHSSITTNKGASTLHQDVEKSCTGGCELVTRREATFSEHALSEPWRGRSAGHQGRGGDARRGLARRVVRHPARARGKEG